MIVCIGIDPSFNSTGICLRYYNNENNNNEIIKEYFVIVKPNKLTKKEIKEDSESINFEYILYQKTDLKQYNDNNIIHEYWKTINIINLANMINDVVCEYCKDPDIEEIYIIIEGISYGSTLRTKAVFDLAGLNYVIRKNFINKDKIKLYIVPPTHIKKFATGKGNANKEDIIEIFKLTHKDIKISKIDDLADAYYMSCYGLELYKNDNID